MPHPSLFESAQARLGLNNQAMAAQLRCSPEWYSKVINGHRPASGDLMLRLEDLLRRSGIEPSSFKADHLNSGDLPRRAETQNAVSLGKVASRLSSPVERRTPAVREDCEAYFAGLINAASRAEDPNAWPVILHRLKKEFPLSEWDLEKE